MYSIESFHLSGHTFRFGLQENELSSVITQTVPLESTHQELSFERGHTSWLMVLTILLLLLLLLFRFTRQIMGQLTRPMHLHPLHLLLLLRVSLRDRYQVRQATL